MWRMGISNLLYRLVREIEKIEWEKSGAWLALNRQHIAGVAAWALGYVWWRGPWLREESCWAEGRHVGGGLTDLNSSHWLACDPGSTTNSWDTCGSLDVEWRSLVDAPHRMVRKPADNSTGMVVNHENLWASFFFFSFYYQEYISSHFL